MQPARILLLFADGVGLGEADPEVNPFVRATTPALRALLGRPLAGREPVRTSDAVLVPLDATLDTPGLPQSATGQTSLLTGANAVALIGRHLTAYPTPTLAGLLAERGLFAVLRARGVSVALANAYSPRYFEAVAARRLRHAAITLHALQAGVRLRGLDDLRAGRAVYQDLTNTRLREAGEDVPPSTSEAAGRHLAAIASDHAFTLFEFFQSDLAGHRRIDDPVGVVERLDRCLGAALAALDLSTTLVLLTSDHGNLEDERTTAHTRNPVPALLAGAGRDEAAAGLRTIMDVAPACVRALGAASPVV